MNFIKYKALRRAVEAGDIALIKLSTPYSTYRKKIAQQFKMSLREVDRALFLIRFYSKEGDRRLSPSNPNELIMAAE